MASVPAAAPVAPPAAPRMPVVQPQPVAGVPTGERLVGSAQPPQAQPHPPSTSQLPGRPGAGGGITVPPLPPVPGATANGNTAGRRPLSNEDFEEELDIPEFLRQ
jgi:cell division protein FtsZ